MQVSVAFKQNFLFSILIFQWLKILLMETNFKSFVKIKFNLYM